MTYHGGKFYITDLGRDRIYILESKEKDDNPGVQVLGETGKRDGQFRDPAGLVVDDLGYVCTVNVVRLAINKLIQGVPQYWAHFVFCYFVSFYYTEIQKFGEC